MQNPQHFSVVSRLARDHITPGGPEDAALDAVNDADDRKYASDHLNRSEHQISAYFNSKYTPNQLKDLVETVFEQHFDKESNGDIDVTEFTNALQNLGLNMNKSRMEKLFNLISITDDASDPYIDKLNFSDFLKQNYKNNPQLQQYREELLTAISPKFADTNESSTKMDILPSLTTSKSELDAMKRHLGEMVENELREIEADSLFQEELIKRKTNSIATNTTFCEENNAKQWDKYEVAYWVGNILGFNYCMKRFFDKKIDGNMLLFDVDANMLQKYLLLKSIHLNSFQRRLGNLKRTALKEMYDAERQKELQHEQKEKELKRRNRIQQIQLEATINESRLNKEITSLTKDKLNLMKQMHELKEKHEDEMKILRQEMGHMKKKNLRMKKKNLMDKEKETLKQEIQLLKSRNEALKSENTALKSKNEELEILHDDAKQVELPDNCYKLEIENLKSKLRTKGMQNDMLQRKMKSFQSDVIDNYQGDQMSSACLSDDVSMTKVMDQSPNKARKKSRNQFPNINNKRTQKKSFVDHTNEEDGMIIYDSDNTPL